MAGGLAAGFKLETSFDDENYEKDLVPPCTNRSTTEVFTDISNAGGGNFLDRAWIFNGESWKEIAPMSVVRDRPACSLVEMDDEEVS